MSKQPLLIMLLTFCLGIFSQDYFGCVWWLGCVLSFFACLFLILSLRKYYFALRFQDYFLGLFFFGIGMFCHWQNSQIPNLPTFDQPKQNIVFQIKKKLNSSVKNRRYTIEILQVKSEKSHKANTFLSVINIPKSQSVLDFEHYYQAEVYLNQVKPADFDFQFDYQKYLSRQGVFYHAYLPNDFQKVEKPHLSIADKIRQKRLSVLQRINQSSLSVKNKEFLKGIILADRTDMDSELVQDFSKSGLVHLLAISGSHMVIIFWLILLVLNPVFSSKYKYFPIIIALLLIWMFAVFIDYGSSVVRSCIMISVYYVMVMLQRKPDLLHSIAVSAFAILLIDTQQLFDVGFHLSYIAVLGIYWLNPVIIDKFPKPRFVLEKLFYNIVSISLSAQLATLPLVLYYFHQFSTLSIIANLVVLPFSEIIIVFSLLMVVLYSFGIYWKLIDVIYNFFIEVLLKVIHAFASMDFFMNENVGFSLIEIFISFIILYYLKFVIQKFDYKSLLRLSFSILVFVSVRWCYDVYYFNKMEILKAEYFGKAIIVIKSKASVSFIIKDKMQIPNLEKFFIKPYMTSRRQNHYVLIKAPENADAVVYKNRRISFK